MSIQYRPVSLSFGALLSPIELHPDWQPAAHDAPRRPQRAGRGLARRAAPLLAALVIGAGLPALVAVEMTADVPATAALA